MAGLAPPAARPPLPPGGTGPANPQAGPVPPLPTAVGQAASTNTRAPTQGIPRIDIRPRETWQQLEPRRRRRIIVEQFANHNYFEYHRLGHTWGVAYDDPTQPWWRAVGAPDSHWAVYRWDHAQRPQRLAGHWHDIYRIEARPPNLTPGQKCDIRRRARYRVGYRAGLPNRRESSIPPDAHANLQNAVDRANIRIKVIKVFSAGGQASLPDHSWVLLLRVLAVSWGACSTRQSRPVLNTEHSTRR